MKFYLNIFLLSVAALAVVHASEDGSEETRKMQGYYNYNDYSDPSDYYGYGYNPKKTKGKGKRKKGAPKRGQPTGNLKGHGPEPSDCAARLCDSKFKAASYGGYRFTRENCKWTPSKTYKYPFDGCKIDKYSTYEQVEACECYWAFEAQCQTNVFCPPPKSPAGMIAPSEREVVLATKVEYDIINDGLCYPSYYRKLESEGVKAEGYYDQVYGPGYGQDYYAPAYSKCPFDTCFSEHIYNCFCKPNAVYMPSCNEPHGTYPPGPPSNATRYPPKPPSNVTMYPPKPPSNVTMYPPKPTRYPPYPTPNATEYPSKPPNNVTRKLTRIGKESNTEECKDSNVDEKIWPLPASFAKGEETRRISHNLIFEADQANPTLQEAFERYKTIMFPSKAAANIKGVTAIDDSVWASVYKAFDRFKTTLFPSKIAADGKGLSVIDSVRVSVKDWSEDHPQLDTKEDYILFIPSSHSTEPSKVDITASTIYGVLRALDTLSQLVQYDYDSNAYTIDSAPWAINDEPRFSHRGILMDTARHFLPVTHIKSLIDSMSYAKLNVLHWHIADSESFPLEIKTFPSLTDGAYSKKERYAQTDVADIVEYARLRGIRVMMEIDMPGHAESWCVGMPEICPSADCKGPLDLSKDKTFEIIDAVMQELTSTGLVPDDMFHLGGDEVDLRCWRETEHVADWLEKNSMSPLGGFKYFIDRVSSVAKSKGKRPVQWVEVFEQFTTGIDKDTVIHVWKDKLTLKNVVAAGYDAILSDQKMMYLDHLDTQWFDLYEDEPYEDIYDPDQQERVLGGQANMWGEHTDGSNLLNTVWPRAAAFAERMWSPRAVSSSSCALPRIKWFRELLLSRGIPTAPVTNAYARAEPSGPGSIYL